MPIGVHLPRVSQKCARCGKTFSRIGSDADRIYCSRECWRQPRKPSAKIRCLRCGKEKLQTTHKKMQVYCSVRCARLYENEKRRKTNREKGVWPNPREAKDSLLKEFRGCQKCGWCEVPGALELHHKDRNRRHNHRSNLQLLCPNCHTVEHFISRTGQFKNNLGRRR
jgi:hypothetical protein